MRILLPALAALAFAAALPAAASTVLLDFNPTFDGHTWNTVTEEDGFTFQNTSQGNYGELSLHNDYGEDVLQSTITRPDGRRFDAHTTMLVSYSHAFRVAAGPHPARDPLYEFEYEGRLRHYLPLALDYEWIGRRNGAVVAAAYGTTPTAAAYRVDWAPFVFGDDFRDLDALSLEIFLPENAALDAFRVVDAHIPKYAHLFVNDPSPDPGQIVCDDTWCGGVIADDLILTIRDDVAPAPVPLPAGLPLLGAALGGLALARAKRRAARS